MLDNLFRQYIGRVVAFVLAPVLLVAVPPVTNAINAVLGTGLNDAQVTQVAIAQAVGVAAVIYKWLANRGRHEIAAAERALLEVQAQGRELAG